MWFFNTGSDWTCELAEAALHDWPTDVDARVKFATKMAESMGMLKANQVTVIVTGWQSGSGYTNTIRVVPFKPAA